MIPFADDTLELCIFFLVVLSGQEIKASIAHNAHQHLAILERYDRNLQVLQNSRGALSFLSLACNLLQREPFLLYIV